MAGKAKGKRREYFTLVVNCPTHGATSLESMFMAGVRLGCGCSFHATNHNGQGWELKERGPNKPMGTDAKVLIAMRQWSKKASRK